MRTMNREQTKAHIRESVSRPYEYIVIHHSATKDGATSHNWEAIRKYHKETNGWNDIGYHFGIEYVDNVLTIQIGRALSEVGAHAKNFNKTGIGICVVGNFDDVAPSQEVMNELVWLLNELRSRFPDAIVVGHRETYHPKPAEKSCPGVQFNLENLRQALNA